MSRQRTIEVPVTDQMRAYMTGEGLCQECWANETATVYGETLPNPGHVCWTITNDGPDATGKTIYMVRLNGKAHSRAFSMSEARHLLNRHKTNR